MNIISIHTQHDANLTVQVNGEIILILELERLFNKRYFSCSNKLNEFIEEWKEVMKKVEELTAIKQFDIAITNWVVPSQVKSLKKIIKADKWLKCDHHLAHAALGYYTSSFKNPLILSADGGGNDGIFNFYTVEDRKINLLERNQLNLGTPYRLLATLMPEITNNKAQPRMGHLSLSGKIMGYSALGKIIDKWIEPLKNYYYHYQYPVQALYALGDEIGLDLEEGFQLDKENARNLAATSQKVFEIILIDEINRRIKIEKFDGIVLSGGIALNVSANSKIKDYFNMDVHIPSAPNDSGISTGSIFSFFPPKQQQSIVFKGLPLIDNIPENIKATSIELSIREIAELLVSENAIIGVIRGRSEFGPRALGNRSIICYPDTIEKKNIINKKIKFREWFRPLAPIVKEDKTSLFFGRKIKSPNMSFAYPLKKEMQGKFSAIEHLDKTARLQTVTKTNNKWIYSLLDEIEKLTSYPILLNTSFNTKGKPLLTNSLDALEILTETDLTHIIVNDKIYSKSKIINLQT